jgi:hypothetical protein
VEEAREGNFKPLQLKLDRACGYEGALDELMEIKNTHEAVGFLHGQLDLVP